MSFNSLVFVLIYIPLLFLAIYLCPVKYRCITVLLFNIIFYSYNGIINTILLLIVSLFNYVFGLLINKKKNICLLFIFVAIDLVYLSFFKYKNNYVLPLGISFYIFNSISYVADIYKNKIEVERNILYYLCYSTLFTHVSMGPIISYKEIKNDIRNINISLDNINVGFKRFLFGLFKKVLIADNLGKLYISLKNDNTSSLLLIISIIVYGLQLYIDFSSYSDMAIGLGKCLNINYSENFNYPYLATTISDFWRKWHISLSKFFKEYVYIPLGGNRNGLFSNVINILIVWILTGVWHGNTINFIFWGMYYGIILLLEKFVFKNLLNKLPNYIKHVYVVIVLFFGYTLFANVSFVEIKSFYINLFTLPFISNNLVFYLKENIVLIIIAVILCFRLPNKFKNNTTINVVSNIAYTGLYILSIAYMLSNSFMPFLYSAF